MRLAHAMLFPVALLAPTAVCGADVSAARQGELRRLVKQDCGSCHGMTLKGGLGKPLRAADLKDKPEGYLKAVILNGLPGTAMPPWKALLSEPEAEQIARMLKTGELER